MIDKHSNKIIHFLYGLKATICVWLDWWKEPDPDGEYEEILRYTHPLERQGGSYGNHNTPTIHWCRIYGVGRGILTNWWVFYIEMSNE